MLWVVVLLFVAVVLAALHLLLVKPFFQGKLPTSVGKWVGRTIHYPKLPFVVTCPPLFRLLRSVLSGGDLPTPTDRVVRAGLAQVVLLEQSGR